MGEIMAWTRECRKEGCENKFERTSKHNRTCPECVSESRKQARDKRIKSDSPSTKFIHKLRMAKNYGEREKVANEFTREKRSVQKAG